MSKRISISFSEWVSDTYLANYKGNTSKFIEGNFVKGCELDAGDYETQKQKLISQSQKLRELEEDNAKLRREVGKYKKALANPDNDPHLNEVTKGLKAIRISGGPLNDMR